MSRRLSVVDVVAERNFGKVAAIERDEHAAQEAAHATMPPVP